MELRINAEPGRAVLMFPLNGTSVFKWLKHDGFAMTTLSRTFPYHVLEARKHVRGR
jgi:hypothetical protein